MLISDLSSDVCSSDLERGVTHRQPHHQCEGESAVDQNLPEFARPCGFDVQMKRLRIVGERGHQQIIGLGDRAADFMLDTLADGPFVEVFSSHRSEEHTSELQSLMRNSYAVFCLKKKKDKRTSFT